MEANFARCEMGARREVEGWADEEGGVDVRMGCLLMYVELQVMSSVKEEDKCTCPR